MKSLLYTLVITIAAAGAQPAGKLRLEHYLDMENVSDPQLSPDGNEIVYARTWIDKINDRRNTDLWIMNANGSKDRFFVNGSSPRWSPDGTRIAYLAQGEPRGQQIFVKYKGLEGSTQITRVDRTPGNLTWSPDGQYIAFTMLVPAKNPWPVKIPGKPEGARWTEEPRFITNLVYRRDRVGYLEEGYVHIFVVPAGGGTARQITQGNWDHGTSGISWTPDGKEILFSSLRIPEAEYAYRESDIYAVNVNSGDVRQLTTRSGPDYAPQVSPDGKSVAYVGYDWTDDTYRDARLYVMNIDGTGHRELTATLDRTPQGLIWAPDNSGVYFNIQDQGSSNVYFANLKANYRPITQGRHMLTLSSLSKTGVMTGVWSDPHNPGDIVTFTAANPKPNRLTRVNDDVLAGIKLGEVEEIWYPSVDDYRIQGWIVKPPDFDPAKKYPLILVIHGGPHAMYNVGFNFTFQHHAAEGYVVLYTNPRGSTGYGSAFANAIKNAYPGKDYDDLMKGVDEVIKRGYVDEQNLFVYGGSGGGVLTSWIVGHTDRFAAASVNYPVTNWLSFVGTTDGVSWYRNFQKYPWEDPSEHLKRSSLMYVGNVKTPTMLMCGVNDLRTPISQTEEYYQALKVRKVPTVMIRFNDEFHGTSGKPSNYLRTQQYLYYWFNLYKREAAAPAGKQ
ncbi:MAG: acyl-peptide hydrolase [Cyclobacteriaceae bacterium]|nr:MAG: acyl-peptide hydrolase [Cyclobacteriaceae bacterium]